MSTAGRATASRDPLRALLVALAVDDEIPYPTRCLLARHAAAWVGSPSSRAALSTLATRLGLPAAQLARGLRLRSRASRLAEGARAAARELGVALATAADPEYPRALLDLSLPPPALWIRGALPSQPALAVVGARRADAYGLAAAERFGGDLAALGLVVVSGFARGADAAAHRGALAVPGGRTVAVLGCGIDVHYPRAHRRLAAAIATAGALVSEFPPGTLPSAWRFPVRNRLIAALGLGTLVVQATRRSGSLITARLALELGRDVYAVPGRIFDPLAAGPNDLLADGALVARAAEDLAASLPLAERDRLRTPPESAPSEPAGDLPRPARSLLAALRPDHPQSAEELARATGLGPDRTLATLLELELAGRVRRWPGPAYTLAVALALPSTRC